MADNFSLHKTCRYILILFFSSFFPRYLVKQGPDLVTLFSNKSQIMSVTSSGPHPRFLSIREFIIHIEPVCNLDVHPLDPPTEILPTSTRWQ